MNAANQERQHRKANREIPHLSNASTSQAGRTRAARHLMVCEVNQQLYALPIEPIEQIIEMVTITPVPQVNTHLEGIINVRGMMVPVVNLGLGLGYAATKLLLHTPIVLVWIRGRMVGLVVDQVVDVISVDEGQVTDPVDMLPEGLGELPLLEGVVRDSSRTMLLLDLERLFTTRRAGLAETLAAFSVLDSSFDAAWLSPSGGDDEAVLSQAGSGLLSPPGGSHKPSRTSQAGNQTLTELTDDEGVQKHNRWTVDKLVRRRRAASRRPTIDLEDGEGSGEVTT